MKKLYTIYFVLICIVLVFFFTSHLAMAQQIGDLKGIHYQAVAIDENGKEIAGTDINGKPLYAKP